MGSEQEKLRARSEGRFAEAVVEAEAGGQGYENEGARRSSVVEASCRRALRFDGIRTAGFGRAAMAANCCSADRRAEAAHGRAYLFRAQPERPTAPRHRVESRWQAPYLSG